MKEDRSWNSPGDRRFIRRFKEYWVDLAGAALFGVILVVIAAALIG